MTQNELDKIISKLSTGIFFHEVVFANLLIVSQSNLDVKQHLARFFQKKLTEMIRRDVSLQGRSVRELEIIVSGLINCDHEKEFSGAAAKAISMGVLLHELNIHEESRYFLIHKASALRSVKDFKFAKFDEARLIGFFSDYYQQISNANLERIEAKYNKRDAKSVAANCISLLSVGMMAVSIFLVANGTLEPTRVVFAAGALTGVISTVSAVLGTRNSTPARLETFAPVDKKLLVEAFKTCYAIFWHEFFVSKLQSVVKQLGSKLKSDAVLKAIDSQLPPEFFQAIQRSPAAMPAASADDELTPAPSPKMKRRDISPSTVEQTPKAEKALIIEWDVELPVLDDPTDPEHSPAKTMKLIYNSSKENQIKPVQGTENFTHPFFSFFDAARAFNEVQDKSIYQEFLKIATVSSRLTRAHGQEGFKAMNLPDQPTDADDLSYTHRLKSPKLQGRFSCVSVKGRVVSAPETMPELKDKEPVLIMTKGYSAKPMDKRR